MIADYIEQAAQYIEVHGWCQREYETPNGNVCAMGALASVTGYDFLFNGEAVWELYRDVRHALGVYVSSNTDPEFWTNRYGVAISEWNDHPEQTADEVIKTMRACAAKLRETI